MSEAWQLSLCFVFCAAGMILVQHRAGATVRSIPGFRQSSGNRSIPVAGVAIAGLAGLQMCALFLLLTARPVMSALLCITLQGLLYFLNTVKVAVLREPLVLADAWLLGQVFTYPEMYFPFLPLKRLLLGLLVLSFVLLLLIFGERPLPLVREHFAQLSLLALFALPIGASILMHQGKLPVFTAFLLRLCPVSHDAKADALRNGALASALMHPIRSGQMRWQKPDFLSQYAARPKESIWPESLEQALRYSAETAPERKPHVLLIQAESFCDVREFLPEPQKSMLQDFLPNWDKLHQMGRTLPTSKDAFGAYTMRMEFSVLTGLSEQCLGPLAFNPYILAAQKPLWSLARHFTRLGYSSVCLHPYHRKFFRRDKVMPNLGFESFHALHELGRLNRFGPYVADAALGYELIRHLSRSEKPVFGFCITVEAHGPWLEGRLTDEQIAATLSDLEYSVFPKPVQMYLCHLRHMDQLFGMLDSGKADVGSGREILLWAYGDHPPSITW